MFEKLAERGIEEYQKKVIDCQYVLGSAVDQTI